jgi:hypothetical protein
MVTVARGDQLSFFDRGIIDQVSDAGDRDARDAAYVGVCAAGGRGLG